jgi:hypothetical protein
LQSWKLELRPPGKGTLEVDLARKRTKISLTPEQWTGLMDILKLERVTGLRRTLGGDTYFPLDSGGRHLFISCAGGTTHRVFYYSIADDDESPGGGWDQVSRFLRTWRALRGLFDDPDALDERAEDRWFIRE